MSDPGLSARLRVPREHFVVEVALEVAAGETLAVMGPSGAGKSTLLAALVGLVALEDGEISVDGRVVERTGHPRVHVAPMRRGTVLLGQDPRLFPHLSARENVAFGPRAAGVPRARARVDADAWLERVGLAGAGDRAPAELSGGEQQRVAVARALAASPRVVLLDEPLVALDPVTAADIRGMLRERLDGVTTIAVTHDAADAVALADRLLVVEEGRMRQAGPVRDVLAAPTTAYVAALAGLNRVVGVAEGGAWRFGRVRLESAETASRAPAVVDGTALAVVFAPHAARLVASDAPGAWPGTVQRLEPTVVGVRVQTEWGALEVPVSDAAHLRVGDAIAARVDPAAVRFVPA